MSDISNPRTRNIAAKDSKHDLEPNRDAVVESLASSGLVASMRNRYCHGIWEPPRRRHLFVGNST